MWYRVRRTMQYVGLISVSVYLCNGITYNPLAAADKAEKEPDSSIKAAVAENYGKLPLSS